MAGFDYDFCDICGKTIAADKPRTQVTQHLFVESRCQCVVPERVASGAMRKRPDLMLQDKDRAQGLKFVSPTAEGEEPATFAVSSELQHDLGRIQANLPARYEVSGFFGQGGMGAVFKAFDHDENRPVAIKVIRPQLANDADAIKRFEHEAMVAKALSHPNIATVYDYGIGVLGAPYLVMESVDGESLEKLSNREGPLKSKRTLAIAIQIARALQAAHEQGILHRDIKPSNIIVFKSGSTEVAKLTDFGIAKSLLPASELSQSITQTGLLVGSPMYMSPEQCEGHAFDHRSDIYSLGCVIYKCLCGETPFQSENALKVLLQHIEEEPAPICTRVRDHLSDDLNYIVMSCLDKNPDLRYRSAKELADDLENRLAGRKILFHSSRDYSPVHVIYDLRSSDENQMTQSAEIYTKSGWKQHEAVNAKYSGHLVMLCFFAPMFLIPLIGVSIYNRTNKHADAERILQLNQLIAPKSGRISNSEIAQNSKSLKEAILYLTANAQEALLKKDYERAANQFGLLTAIYRVLQDDKSGADNFYYLAHCQAAMKRYELARDNYARAIELYKGSTETQATSLLPRLTAELQAISGKTDENSK